MQAMSTVVSLMETNKTVEVYLVDGNHCSDVKVDFSMDSKLDQVKNWWSANSYKYASYSEGLCPSTFGHVDHLEHPIGVSGVTLRDMGMQAMSTVVSLMETNKTVEVYLVDGNHCSDVKVDFSMDSKLDQVKNWWSANSYKYASYSEGLCPSTFG